MSEQLTAAIVESPFIVAGERKQCPVCPTHGCQLVMRRAQYGKFWGCPEWPDCDICANFSEYDQRWRLSDQALRNEKHLAHDALDALWRGGRMTRNQCYRWLREAMDLPKHKCHIQHMTEAGCRRVVELATEKMAALQ